MNTTIAPALVGLTAALACKPAPADELRLRKVHDHHLVIEGPFGGTRGYVRATPSGQLVFKNSWGWRVGGILSLPGRQRAIMSAAGGRLLGIVRLKSRVCCFPTQ